LVEISIKKRGKKDKLKAESSTTRKRWTCKARFGGTLMGGGNCKTQKMIVVGIDFRSPPSLVVEEIEIGQRRGQKKLDSIMMWGLLPWSALRRGG